MSQTIDYIALISPRSEVGTDPTRFTVHRDGDSPQLLADSRFSFLFVLRGKLMCSFKCSSKTLLIAPQMVVIDKFQIRELRCVGDTVLLECVESPKMVRLMQSTLRIFRMPCSEIITLNSKMEEWCGAMLTDLLANPNRDNDYHHVRCRNLTALLLEYPEGKLGALYVALYACGNQCANCTKQFVR